MIFALLVAVAMTAVSREAEATFPGQNGRIAFSSDRDYEIYTMRPDGTDMRKLTNNTISDYYPAWSADGTKMVFTKRFDSANNIFIMDTDGKNKRRVGLERPRAVLLPRWHPDRVSVG